MKFMKINLSEYSYFIIITSGREWKDVAFVDLDVVGHKVRDS